MNFLIAVCCIICCTVFVSAQDIRDIHTNSNGITLRTRAYKQMADTTKRASTIKMFEDWLRAVPNDAEVLKSLAELYKSVGRPVDANFADSVAKRITNGSAADRTMFVRQTRFGRYTVVMPKNVQPSATYPLLVFLHGNGNNPKLMEQWFSQMSLDSVIAIFPEAPYPKLSESISAQREMYSASGSGLGFSDELQSEVISLSAEWYHDVVQHARQNLPVSTRLPILIGFSQGGFYAYVVSSRHPESFSSVVTVCASMYADGKVEQNLPKLRTYGIDVLLTHGTKDPIVAFQTSELIKAMLSNAGVGHSYIPFDGGHWPSSDITKQIKQWILDRLR